MPAFSTEPQETVSKMAVLLQIRDAYKSYGGQALLEWGGGLDYR